jgi:signal transduction histidine kinase
MRFSHLVILTALLFAKSPDAFTSDLSGRVVVYNNENGLPQNTVSCIAFDRHGALWVGTNGGLVRFDGRNFDQIGKQIGNPRIVNILRSYADTIWILDENLTLYYYDESSAQLLLHTEKLEDQSEFLKENILGGEFLGVQADIGSRSFTYPLEIQSTSSENSLYSSSSDTFLVYLDEYMRVIPDLPRSAKFTVVENFLVAKRGRNQIGVFHKGKHQYDINGLRGNGQIDLDSFWERAYFFNSEGGSFAIYDGFLYELRLDNKGLKLSKEMSGVPAAKNIRTALYRKSDKVLVIGTNVDGLMIVTPLVFKSFLIDRPYDPVSNAKYESNNIYSMIEYAPGKLLASNGMIYEGEQYTQFLPQNMIDPYLLYQSQDGKIWYFNTESRLVALDRDWKEQVSIPFQRFLISMVEAVPGTYYVIDPDFVFKIVCENNNCEVRDKIASGVEYSLTKIFKYSDTILWLSGNKGLLELNTVNNKIKQVPGSGKIHYRDIQRSAATGNIWVGTYGFGFFLYKDSLMLPLHLDKGGYLLHAHTFLPDKNGFLWISTNNGVFQVLESDLIAYTEGRSRDVYYHYYDRSYGFYSNEFNGGGSNSGYIASDGSLYFASLNGLVSLRPDNLNPLTPKQPLITEYIKVNGMPFNLQGGKLELQPNFNTLQIKLSSPYFGHSYNLHVQYRVLGLDSTWRELPSDMLLQLPNINPGEYKIEFIKLNGFGVDNFETLTLPFSVKPYFYRRPLFYVFLAILVILIGYGSVRWRIKSLESSKKMLEQIVQMRTATLQTALDEVRQHQQTLVGKQEAFQAAFQVVMHDLVSPLRFLRRLSHKIRDDYGKMSGAEVQRDLETMQASAMQAEQFTRDLLVWMKAQEQRMSFKLDLCNPAELVKKNLLLYQWIAEEKGIHLEIEEPVDETDILINAELVGIILRNILDNAVKNTQTGSVRIRAEVRNHQLQLQIRDTGIGMNQQAVQHLNAGRIPYHLEQDKHLGMRLIFDILQIIDGRFQIESKIGKGTAVSVIIPIALDEVSPAL